MKNIKRQSILYTLLAILSLFIIVGILWFMNDSRDMKTYNDAQTFTIKYPADWEVQKNSFGAAVIFLSPKENELDVFQENVNVVIQTVEDRHRNLKTYTTDAIEQIRFVFKESLEIIESTSENLNGQLAYRFTYLGHGPETDFKVTHLWTVFPETNTAYQLTFTALESSYDKFSPIANKIMKSIKFK